jgi:hypothetical protein
MLEVIKAVIQQLPTTLAVIGSVAAIMIALRLWQRGTHDRSYDAERQHVLISEMRSLYEHQIALATKQLMATEERWRDVNHLILESQTKQPVSQGDGPELSAFLKSLGITKNDLIIDPRMVVVLTPFLDEQMPTFETAKMVCSRNGFVCVRGDEEYTERDILSHVVKLIVRARVVIANVTLRNPNVYYELGIAHALDKPTILISETINDVPFDLRSKRILLFSDQVELGQKLPEMLLQVVAQNAKN